MFDSAAFRQVLGHFVTGVTVITAAGPDGPVGMSIGSFTSVSLEPPLVGFLPGRTSTSWPDVEASGSFCVNILAADQEHLSRVFASKAADKFDGVGWRAAPATGSPMLDGALAIIDCDIAEVVPAGDHWFVMGRVRELHVVRDTAPLVFYRGGYGQFSV
jgi:flavin reductase (DIM6/NTAB) family NADH-FMN oxidoreductase RutF